MGGRDKANKLNYSSRRACISLITINNDIHQPGKYQPTSVYSLLLLGSGH